MNFINLAILITVYYLISVSHMKFLNMFDLRYWRCVLKRTNKCPVPEVKVYLYAISDTGILRRRVDVRNPKALNYCGWDPHKKNSIIIHGFNGSEEKTPMSILRNAYLKRGDYNVFTIDWKPLTEFPCYLSALQNTRLVSQCAAQFYSYLTNHGALANETVCIGHSLGAHICGMMTSHLSKKQGRIIGLDPARPLINRFAKKEFKLSREDAYSVQIIHSNAGFLGETNQIGHVDFCINGGQYQPGCYGHKLRQSRCSHFQAVCYLAHTVKTGRKLLGYPCTNKCPRRRNSGILAGKPIALGEDISEKSRGMYCVEFSHNNNCPFD